MVPGPSSGWHLSDLVRPCAAIHRLDPKGSGAALWPVLVMPRQNCVGRELSRAAAKDTMDILRRRLASGDIMQGGVQEDPRVL
jgi:hypothetical protein